MILLQTEIHKCHLSNVLYRVYQGFTGVRGGKISRQWILILVSSDIHAILHLSLTSCVAQQHCHHFWIEKGAVPLWRCFKLPCQACSSQLIAATIQFLPFSYQEGRAYSVPTKHPVPCAAFVFEKLPCDDAFQTGLENPCSQSTCCMSPLLHRKSHRNSCTPNISPCKVLYRPVVSL